MTAILSIRAVIACVCSEEAVGSVIMFVFHYKLRLVLLLFSG